MILSTSMPRIMVARTMDRCRSCLILIAVALSCALSSTRAAASTMMDAIAEAEPKIVKIYGAGGIRGLEAYQSGFVISDEGHVLTAWSYVLDTDAVVVTLSDGRRFEAELLGADPRLEIAILKIDGSTPDFFSLAESRQLMAGDRVLAFSNLYGIATGNEPSSVLHGTVSAVTPLSARRGVFKTPYNGPAYIIDAVTNNSGAAGGALTDHAGRIAGILGKELRSAETNAWLNYAIPINELRDSVQAIIEGRTIETPEEELTVAEDPWTSQRMGVRFVPNVLAVTPPFVEQVVADSIADRVGLQPDDLVIYVDQTLVRSLSELQKELSKLDFSLPLPLTIMRNHQIIQIELDASND